MPVPVSTRFSDEYQKAADALGKAQPPQPWRGTLVSLAALVAAEGPHASHADALTALRRQVQGKPGAGGAAAGRARTEADALLEAAGASPRSSSSGPELGLAAALKLLRHLYLARQRGSHKVWVLSLPVSFTDWPSAELAAASAAELPQKLAAPGERFSLEDRKHLSDCTQEAMRWCMKTLILLADAQGPAERGRAAARAMVSRWFADADTDEAGLDTLIGTLQPGFKKILGVLGSGRLVLTDHPQARGSTLADSEAFVFTQREPLDVVYVEGAFFGSGNLLKGLKNWTRILVHELSHREQKTVDKFYAWQGIKPVVGGFPSADAIVNAESWAFFCADAAGALTDGDRQSALQ